MKIRPLQATDIPPLQSLLDQIDLFPSDMLPDMTAGFLNVDKAEDIWLTCEVDGTAIGLCYAKPEMLADGTWNMLAIGVHPTEQGKGAGAAMAQHLEGMLRDTGQRILIVDTSSSADFADARRFYDKNGYTQEARIRDFWGPQDDKVIFWKQL